MSKGKLIAIIVVIVILIVGFALYKKGVAPTDGVPGNTGDTSGTGAIDGPAPTGSVDDAAASILLDLQNDELGADIDASSVAENDTAISEFGQSLDASQF